METEYHAYVLPGMNSEGELIDRFMVDEWHIPRRKPTTAITVGSYRELGDAETDKIADKIMGHLRAKRFSRKAKRDLKLLGDFPKVKVQV